MPILTACRIPSFVISKIQNCHSTLPGTKNRLNATVIKSMKNRGFRPFSMNFTGTLDMMMIVTRNTVASRYPQKEFATKRDTRNMIVPTNFTRGSSLWRCESAG